MINISTPKAYRVAASRGSSPLLCLNQSVRQKLSEGVLKQKHSSPLIRQHQTPTPNTNQTSFHDVQQIRMCHLLFPLHIQTNTPSPPGRSTPLLPTTHPQRLPRPRRHRLLPTTLRLLPLPLPRPVWLPTTLRPTRLRCPTAATATAILPTTTTRPVWTATGWHDVRAATSAAAGVLREWARAEAGGCGGGALCGAVGVGGLLLLFGFFVLGG